VCGSLCAISRGIGLAVTKLLVEEFGAIVVAISRTRTPELADLLGMHKGSLLAVECSVSVLASPSFCLSVLEPPLQQFR
jgi:NAD(P)-dependent dehydrogenase (short-subunit alcohol dehydrogenase family)